MKQVRIGVVLVLAAVVAASTSIHVMAAAKKPVYVGVAVCAQCHSAKSMGGQYGSWLRSRHSVAFAVLAKPEALEIAKLSGLRTRPQESAICLGCHATGWQAEEWEKDHTFQIEDGVQCERCHGAGSEYASAAVMKDKQAAMKAGLQMPDKSFCAGCHQEKGSHVAVLKRPPADVEKGWAKLLHPLPPDHTLGAMVETANPASNGTGPKFVGAASCGACHRGGANGNQWSAWRMTAHAGAWAALGSAKALEMAKAKGVSDPQTSPECLKCHTTSADGPHAEAFRREEGVGCEACHGAGSDYMLDGVMRDKRAAQAAGLKPVSRETCMRCHTGHDFDFDAAKLKVAHSTTHVTASAETRYKTPIRLAFRPGGNELWVTAEASDSVIVIDTQKQEKSGEIKVGGNPTDVTFTPDGNRAFVTNRLDDTVTVIDAKARNVESVLKVGNEPHGLLTDREGKYLYVLNTSSNDISVFEVATLKRVKNLSASNGPWSLAMSPDGRRILVTNMKARFAALRAPFVSEVTEIDPERGVVNDRVVVPGANLMMGVAWHPSGKFALATLNRTKAAIPMTRLLQGWTITNGLAVLWSDGRIDEVLLDETDKGFADATDVACTRDGRYALVTSAGTDRVAVVDLSKLIGMVEKASPYEREHVLPNHLGKPSEFITARITTGKNPRGIVVAPDNRFAYVTNSLDDNIGVIDLAQMRMTRTIDLGGPKMITKQRWGEQLFHNAFVTFHRQYSCNSCHPDGHVDGMTYDIEADGIGISPVDNRTLRGILDTAPFKWEGTNPSLSRQCGARLAVFFTRLAPFTPEQLSAVDYYVTTIPRPPNRFRPLGAELTPAQRRGKQYFERTMTNDGREIAQGNRCVTCHFPPYYTDRKRHDVGTKLPFDRTGNFDVPHLNNIYDSAPYLHNGMAASLEEIWTVYNAGDMHGVTNDMTKDQLNDLIEYLKTL